MADIQGAIQRLNTSIERNLQALNFPGLAIGITNRERLLFLGEYGLANRDKQTPITPDTLFQIGSISKAFTSIVLLQLQEQGVLEINDPVTQYIPWFQVQSEFNRITLQHLMSHTAGIITGVDDNPTALTEAWHLRHTRATTPPGERFHYSNSGYKALGLVLETVLQKPISQILRERVLLPLGMDASEPVITHSLRSRLAVGYEAYYDDRPLPKGGLLAPATWFETNTADGSICSTAGDMCRYLRSLLNYGRGILTKESFYQLIYPYISTGDDLHGEHYGLGLSTRQIEGHQVIGHSGGMVGYTADLIADLNGGVGVVVLTNGPGNPEKLSLFVLSLLHTADRGEARFPDLNLDPEGIQLEDYIGIYHGENHAVTLTVRDDLLYLDFEGESLPLEPYHPDAFLVPHPAWALYPLRFSREGAANHPEGMRGQKGVDEKKGPITCVIYGPEVFMREDFDRPFEPEYPEAWKAYPGHYRSHNPWYSNFRIVLRKGELFLIEPSGIEEPLLPLEPGVFRVGVDPGSPEFMRFEAILNGKASIVHLSGGAYSRTFTP